MPWRAQDFVHCPLRRRAGRPQLKRDPLGGALPPSRHSDVNRLCTKNPRGADPLELATSVGAPHPTAPRPRYNVPRRASSFDRWAVQRQLRIQRLAAAVGVRAARSSIGAGRAV